MRSSLTIATNTQNIHNSLDKNDENDEMLLFSPLNTKPHQPVGYCVIFWVFC